MRSLSNCAVGYTNRSSRKVNDWALCCAGITRVTACQPTARRSTCSGRRLRTAGSSRFGDEASDAASTGRGWIGSRNSGFLVLALFILGRSSALLSGPEIRAQCGSSARWICAGGGGTVTCQSSLPRPYRALSRLCPCSAGVHRQIVLRRSKRRRSQGPGASVLQLARRPPQH
jgi:hypothetical protein